jgi:hypothetical protein
VSPLAGLSAGDELHRALRLRLVRQPEEKMRLVIIIFITFPGMDLAGWLR